MTTIPFIQTGLVTRLVDQLRQSLNTRSLAGTRRRLIEDLNEKSDAELALLGLRREEIARHVFSDLFYS